MSEKKRHARILYLEDDAIWRKEIAEILTLANFHVDSAETPHIVRSKLAQGNYHLVILDISMDETSKNREGMALLGEIGDPNLPRAFETMMLTAYGSKSRLRRAFSKYRVVDFLDKHEFDEDDFVDAVNQAIKGENVNLNLELPNLDEAGAHLKNMWIGENQVKPGEPLMVRVLSELEDLLCRLFTEESSVLLRFLERGLSGTRVFKAEPFFQSGQPGNQVIVKFGEFGQLQRENANFNEYVQPFLGGNRSTNILKWRRTALLGGIVYSFLGAGLEKVQAFEDFFETGSEKTIQSALKRLFKTCCAPWYSSPRSSGPSDLMDYYWAGFGRPFVQVKAARKRLKSVQGRDRLVFSSLGTGQNFADPTVNIENHKVLGEFIECITHGDLNPGNLFIDEHGGSWLIDFQRTGYGHYLRDFVELDTFIRVLLLDEKRVPLQERLAMEETLTSVNRFGELGDLKNRFSSSNKWVMKSFLSVLHLREMAGNIKLLADDNMAGYYTGLFCNALNSIRFSSYAKVQKEHALLSASLILDRLKAMGALQRGRQLF